MKVLSSTELRKNLAKMMDAVTDDHEPLIITRAGGRPVVMLSLEDYDAMDETMYLMSSDANRKALLEAMADLEAGNTIEKTLEELEAMSAK